MQDGSSNLSQEDHLDRVRGACWARWWGTTWYSWAGKLMLQQAGNAH